MWSVRDGGMPLKSTGIGIKSEFCFRQIALARFKTDHTQEALRSEKKNVFLDKGWKPKSHT